MRAILATTQLITKMLSPGGALLLGGLLLGWMSGASAGSVCETALLELGQLQVAIAKAEATGNSPILLQRLKSEFKTRLQAANVTEEQIASASQKASETMIQESLKKVVERRSQQKSLNGQDLKFQSKLVFENSESVHASWLPEHSVDGNFVFVIDDHASVRIWDATTGKETMNAQLPINGKKDSGDILGYGISRDLTKIAIVRNMQSTQPTLFLYDLNLNQNSISLIQAPIPFSEFTNQMLFPKAVQFTPDLDKMLIGSHTLHLVRGISRFLSPAGKKLKASALKLESVEFNSSGNPFADIQITKDGRYGVGMAGSTFAVFDTQTAKPMISLSDCYFGMYPEDLKMSPNGDLTAVIISSTKNANMRNVVRVNSKFDIHYPNFGSLFLLIRNSDGVIISQIPSGHQDKIRSFTFSDDGSVLALAGEKSISLLDTETGQQVSAAIPIEKSLKLLNFNQDTLQILAEMQTDQKDELLILKGPNWQAGAQFEIGDSEIAEIRGSQILLTQSKDLDLPLRSVELREVNP